ncbi:MULTISPECIES: ATP-binding protein [Xanthomonas]|uniref:ATP-binding protein n=1 Tax=Xanthomonas dyei TaxID=743699 RepID=A0ABZ0DGP4_9XANT|nr:ATP-binding protein [Xanthomonas dyei]WOB27753.1 ATP-binding protein [Xanthomonas dyei]WOB55375.1 ATP-binding protein [Xanthomonas dyei]
MAKKGTAANEALFEEDYVLRSLGRIGYDPDMALTELVANTWDAGAAKVGVIIPAETGGLLSVEDDGHGMTEDQFRKRWMTLGYNRQRTQGENVQFPSERDDWVRMAFGRNGIGRHGLLCFSDHYTVETWTNGVLSTFVIGTRNQPSPFYIHSHQVGRRLGHGTRLLVEVEQHRPDPDRIRTVLSGRFLHDPQFIVSVNGQSVPLSQHEGLLEERNIQVERGFSVTAYVVDTTRTAKSTRYQGVAFWVSNRLVGLPSWTVGPRAVLDGRVRFAKRYAIVIECGAEWLSEVEPDWSKFKSTERTEHLFKAINDYAQEMVEKLSANLIEENSEDALYKNREDLRTLPRRSMLEVAQFTKTVVQDQPGISPETLSKVVKAVIKIQKGRSGASFLDKLMQLDEHDIDGLDRLLGQWTVEDALTVLDEIDSRLSIIAAMEKLSGDPEADELHTLHPLVTQARWLFGPEFDSSEYASNNTLRTVATSLFKARKLDQSFANAAKRPDIVVLADATISMVGTESFDSARDHLVMMRDVLLIELKKGRSEIGRPEMNQAAEYVDELVSSGGIEGVPFFHAFVVGHSVASNISTGTDREYNGSRRGRVTATTYNQLALTANRRLHGLKARIPSRYEEVSGYELVQKVMGTPSQASFVPPTE